MRLDQDFEKSLGSDKTHTDIRPKKFLVSKHKPKIKSDLKFSNLMALGSTAEFVQNQHLLLNAARPPLLKDYLDMSMADGIEMPKLYKRVIVQVNWCEDNIPIP